VLRLGTYYLCRSSEGLDDGLEVEVIDKEEEVGVRSVYALALETSHVTCQLQIF
jgi:hypothetical protein